MPAMFFSAFPLVARPSSFSAARLWFEKKRCFWQGTPYETLSVVNELFVLLDDEDEE